MTATFAITANDAIDADLRRLEAAARLPVLRQGLRKAASFPRNRLRQILPKPGYPGDKPDLKPLRDAVSVKLVEYEQGLVQVAIVGYEWGAGSHGHMVEEGHRMVVGGTAANPGAGRKTPRKAKSGGRGKGTVVGFVEGRYYLRSAQESTRAEQDQAIQDAIERAVQEQSNG